MSSTCPNRLLRRLFRLGRRPPERVRGERLEPSAPADHVSSDVTRAERARAEAQRWLAMREREFSRRLEERRGDEQRPLVDAG